MHRYSVLDAQDHALERFRNNRNQAQDCVFRGIMMGKHVPDDQYGIKSLQLAEEIAAELAQDFSVAWGEPFENPHVLLVPFAVMHPALERPLTLYVRVDHRRGEEMELYPSESPGELCEREAIAESRYA